MKMSALLRPTWVHSLDDYRRMFHLDESDLSLTVLDCPAGLSSFTAEMHALGHAAQAVDPAYDLTPIAMQAHLQEVLGDLGERLEGYADRIGTDLAEVHALWNQAARTFLADYEPGVLVGRYQHASLPRLPFEDKQFKLALCANCSLSHDVAAEAQALIAELSRVAEEVRVFPILDEASDAGSLLGALVLQLQQANFGVEIREAPYRFLKGNNAMLRIWTKECVVDTK